MEVTSAVPDSESWIHSRSRPDDKPPTCTDCSPKNTGLHTTDNFQPVVQMRFGRQLTLHPSQIILEGRRVPGGLLRAGDGRGCQIKLKFTTLEAKWDFRRKTRTFLSRICVALI